MAETCCWTPSIYAFNCNCFDRLEIIKEIQSKQDLADIGIHLKGHQILIMARIKDSLHSYGRVGEHEGGLDPHDNDNDNDNVQINYKVPYDEDENKDENENGQSITAIQTIANNEQPPDKDRNDTSPESELAHEIEMLRLKCDPIYEEEKDEIEVYYEADQIKHKRSMTESIDGIAKQLQLNAVALIQKPTTKFETIPLRLIEV